MQPPFFALLVLAACAPHTFDATPPARKSATYDVLIVSGTTEQQVQSHYVLQVEPVREGVWSFITASSEGEVARKGRTMRFDSANPSSSDPWPLLLQHAISTVPAWVSLDPTGRPAALLEQQRWRDEASAAVDALALPQEATQAGINLLDPDGLLADLQRNFPGTPQGTSWTREDRVAGVQVIRNETCTVEQTEETRQWSCKGSLRTPDGSHAKIEMGESSTLLIVDRTGLVDLDTEYSGTLLYPSNTGPRTTAIGGKRKVTRQ